MLRCSTVSKMSILDSSLEQKFAPNYKFGRSTRRSLGSALNWCVSRHYGSFHPEQIRTNWYVAHVNKTLQQTTTQQKALENDTKKTNKLIQALISIQRNFFCAFSVGCAADRHCVASMTMLEAFNRLQERVCLFVCALAHYTNYVSVRYHRLSTSKRHR